MPVLGRARIAYLYARRGMYTGSIQLGNTAGTASSALSRRFLPQASGNLF